MSTADNRLDSQPEKRQTDASSLGQPTHTADNHLKSQSDKRRRVDASSLGQPPHDNHHESQPKKRHQAEASSSSQPLPKTANTANKHVAANTPTKTSSNVATGSIKPLPLMSTTPSTTSSATQASKSTSTMRQATTEPPEKLVDTNMEAGSSPSIKQSQALSDSLLINRESSLPDGNNEPVSERLSSADHIPSIGKQVMLPPKEVERDVAESATGDYESHDEVLGTGVDVAENVHKHKGSDEDLPKMNSAKLTAKVSLNCGTSTEATTIFVTIAKNGMNGLATRFEVTQDGSES